MGMFDWIDVPCANPGCIGSVSFQSKAGKCDLIRYTLEDAPSVVLANIAGEAKVCPKCNQITALKTIVPITLLPILYKNPTPTIKKEK